MRLDEVYIQGALFAVPAIPRAATPPSPVPVQPVAAAVRHRREAPGT